MLSVLTLNLRFGRADDGPNNWSHRQKAYPSLFGKYQPDFITFQEANDFQADFLKTLLNGYRVIGIRTPAPDLWQDNLIFYKKGWECVFKERFFLSHTPGIPSRLQKSRWPRQCTLGMFEKHGRKIICVNTHFDFAEAVQVTCAEIIMGRLSALPSHVPVILAGDFNAEPFGGCYEVFTGKKHRAGINSPYFRDVFRKPFPGTFHGFTGSAGEKHIDWILYRGGIVPEKAQVIQTSVEGIYPSDHFPVRAVFRDA